jgi:hypothetical protein
VTDTRPSITDALDAFGVDAVVTPPGGDPVETRAMWLGSSAEVPPGSDSHRVERRRVLVLPLEGLPAIPRDTVVTLPEYDGADAEDWSIDSVVREDWDSRRVLVVPA